MTPSTQSAIELGHFPPLRKMTPTLPLPSVPAAASTAGAAKRPASPSSFASSDDGATFSQKPAQRPRLNIMKVNCPNPEHKTKHIMTDDEPAASVGANIDLLIHAVSFMHPNNTLYNLCIASDDRWRGIVADFMDDGSYGNHFPGTNVFHQVLMRRNTKMLQYILSHEKFSMDALSAVVRQEGAEIVLFVLGEIGVPIEAREAFVRHPKVTKSLNGLDNMMRDCRAPPLLRIMEHSSLFDQTADEEARIKSKRLIDMLLDATNYRYSSRGDKPRSATEYARRQLEQHPNDPLRKALMRKIDLWGFD